MCPFLFCLAFPLSAAVLIRALPTDWSSVSLWASFSAYALFSFSLSDTIKQKHISKPSERGIFLSFLLLHSAFVFCLHCLVFQSASDSRFALCSSPRSLHVLHPHNFVWIWSRIRECQENRDFTLRDSATVSSTNDSVCQKKSRCPQSVPEPQIAAVFCLLSGWLIHMFPQHYSPNS